MKITNKSRKREYLAGRFAAKEAVIKALAHSGYSFKYTDISVLNAPDGSPYVVLENYPACKILLSLSHSKENSVAVAVLIDKDE